MKKIIEIDENFFHIFSEPDKFTKYDYYVFIDCKNNFYFYRGKENLNWPKKLNYLNYFDKSNKSKLEIESISNYDPKLLAECIRTMKQIKKERNQIKI